MKKNLLLLVLALIGMGGFTACNNEDELLVQEQTNTKLVVIRATIGNVSRLALGNSDGTSTKVSWSEGDAFALTIGDKSYTFNWQEGNDFVYDNNNGDFPATFADAGTITATYPATITDEFSVQSGTKANVGNYMQMAAELDVNAGDATDDLNLKFEHQTSVVEIALAKSELAGKSVVVDLRTITASKYSTPAEEGVLSFDSNGKLTVYFAVSPTGEVVKEWYVGVKDIAGNEYYTATLSDLQLAASKMYKVSKTGEALKNTSYLVSTDGKTVIAYDAEGLNEWAKMANVNPSSNIVNLELGADITLSTEGITLTDELPNKGNWTPLGRTDEYQGTIDGKNHTIKNMYIVDKNSDDDRIGFLGSSFGATIKNLKFENAKIVVGTDSGDDGDETNYIGVISGISRSNIDNCHVVNSIVKCLGKGVALGGLVGSMSPNNADEDTKRITNSSFSGTVDGNEQVGGIVGNLQSWRKGYAFVTGCTVKGTVTGKYMVGGIAGRSGQFTGTAGSSFLGYVSAIEMCTNEATVTGAASGGIVGYQSNYGYAIGCTNQGEIHGTSISIGGTTKSGTGGIVGLVEHYSEEDALKMSYVIGCRNLSTKVYSSADDSNIGGVVGHQNREKSAIYGSYTVSSEENAAYVKHAQQAIGTAFTGGLNSYTQGNSTFASVSAVTADEVSTMNTAITSGFNTAKNYFYKDDKSAYKDYRWSWTSGSWPEFKAPVAP